MFLMSEVPLYEAQTLAQRLHRLLLDTPVQSKGIHSGPSRSKRERERVYVCETESVSVRERESECVCEREYVRESVCLCVCERVCV